MFFDVIQFLPSFFKKYFFRHFDRRGSSRRSTTTTTTTAKTNDERVPIPIEVFPVPRAILRDSTGISFSFFLFFFVWFLRPRPPLQQQQKKLFTGFSLAVLLPGFRWRVIIFRRRFYGVWNAWNARRRSRLLLSFFFVSISIFSFFLLFFGFF